MGCSVKLKFFDCAQIILLLVLIPALTWLHLRKETFRHCEPFVGEAAKRPSSHVGLLREEYPRNDGAIVYNLGHYEPIRRHTSLQ